MNPCAVVLNMYSTGLGIARSLGKRGVPVIGLTNQHRLYGNFTRYAKTLYAPDSRREPEKLLDFLLKLSSTIDHRAVLFPTRDDDLIFFEHYRKELEAGFALVAPPGPALKACLDKWQTYLAAQNADVACPTSWVVESEDDVQRICADIKYPCVLKPLASHYWRQGDNWQLVGGRKAIGIDSGKQLLAEYATISRADPRAVVQEWVPGGDDCLVIAACYLDRKSNFVAGFQARKLMQIPAGYGTGCIVEVSPRPEVNEIATRLLGRMKFTGIAEVEFKWNSAKSEYQLIEVNARPWDQHRLGYACGTDLIYLAYCENAGLPLPALKPQPSNHKWIAEDVLVMTVLRMLWRRDSALFTLPGILRGRRIYAISAARDPVPTVAYLAGSLFPTIATTCAHMALSKIQSLMFRRRILEKEGAVYDSPLQNGKSRG